MPQTNRRLLLPFGITFEDWKAMIVAFLKTGPQPVFAGQAAKAAGLDEHVVRKNVAFLKALGMATASSTESRISLSKAGTRYAQALVSGDRAVQKKALVKCAGAALRPVVRFCELAEGLDFDRLFLQIVPGERGRRVGPAKGHRRAGQGRDTHCRRHHGRCGDVGQEISSGRRRDGVKRYNPRRLFLPHG